MDCGAACRIAAVESPGPFSPYDALEGMHEKLAALSTRGATWLARSRHGSLHRTRCLPFKTTEEQSPRLPGWVVKPVTCRLVNEFLEHNLTDLSHFDSV
jgi:hypothetical protein